MKKRFLSSLAILGLSFSAIAAANENIEIRFPAAGFTMVNPRYSSFVAKSCDRIKKQKYTKGTITCGASLVPKTDAKIQIVLNSNKEDFYYLDAINKNDSNYSAGWKITKNLKYKAAIHTSEKLVKKYISAIEHRRFLEEMLLANIANSTNALSLNKRYQYINPKTGKKVSFEEAKIIVKNAQKPVRNFWRASLNIGILLGIGSTWYWSNASFNAVDWEYKFSWEDYRKKFITFEAVKFDTNTFDTNAIMHPFSGMFYHYGVRSLKMNYFESFLFGFTGSLLWEYFAEFKEKVSINDLITTPVAGAAIGEVGFRMADFLMSSRGLGKQIVGRIVDPFGTVNRFLDRSFPKKVASLDEFGFNANVFHDFSFSTGVAVNKNQLVLNLNTAIYAIKDYLKPSVHTKKFSGGDITIMELETILGASGAQDVKALFEASLVGVQKQNIKLDANKRKKGYSVLVGLNSSYEYRRHRFNKKFLDNVAIVNILGGNIEINVFYKGFHFQTRSSLEMDFIQIKSVAYEKLQEQGGVTARTKSVLEWQKYYFAYGMTARNRTSVGYKNISLNGAIDYTYANSLEGQDREQIHVVDDFNVVDHRIKLNADIQYRFLKRFLVKAGYKYNMAKGLAKEVTEKHSDHLFYGAVGIKF